MQQIYDVEDGQRYWVVRSDNGRFFDHFRNAGIAAIGHLDRLGIEQGIIENISGYTKDFSRSFAVGETSNASISSQIHQATSFVDEMKVGDLVLAPATGSIMFGRVDGGAFINHDPISVIIDEKRGTESNLRYHLRRKVAWGPLVRKSNFPYNVTKSLRANQTVFNVDKHWRAIHHLLYPAFRKNDKLYLSFNINQKEDIDNYSIARFQAFLSEAEVFVDRAVNDEFLYGGDFQDGLKEHIRNNLITVTSQSQYFSDGNLYIALFEKIIGDDGIITAKAAKRILYFSLVYAYITGNSLLGIEGMIDEIGIDVPEIIELYFEHNTDDDVEFIREKLKLNMPNYDTNILEQPDVPPEGEPESSLIV